MVQSTRQKVFGLFEANHDGSDLLGLYYDKERVKKLLNRLYEIHEREQQEQLKANPDLGKAFQLLHWINEYKFRDWNGTWCFIEELRIK